MKVGFVQLNPVFGEKQKNFTAVEKLLKGIDAELIVLPELFNTGYTFLDKTELDKFAEQVTGPTYDFMLKLARQHKCAFAYGFAEKNNSTFFNSAALVTPDGLIGVYRKSHLYFEEKNLFTPGDTGFQLLEYKNIKLGLLVCYDWIYPEAMRTLALKGAQIILHCANLVMPYCPEAHKTRALENGVFIIMANRTGEEKRGERSYKFIGQSEIVGPRGKILYRAQDEECVHVIDIDPGLALDKKMNEYNDIMKDRRDDLYFK
ncbi:MAG: nitrilase-related carbon-nitrogen hydrolase [bacterium]